MRRKKNLTHLAITLSLCSALLVGCAPSGVAGLAVTHPPMPIAAVADETSFAASKMPLQSWYAEARSAVGSELKVDLSGVSLQVTDSDGIAIHAKTSLMGALKHDLRNTDFAENLVDNILSLQTDSVLAIYAPSVKKILLHDRNLDKYLGKSEDNAKHLLQALLVHELVHAADDKKYNAFEQKSMSYQEVFAKSAVIEGHAQWQTRRICQKLQCDNAFEELNTYMFARHTQEDPALQYLQSRSFKNLEFVYKEGERFIDKIQSRNPGSDIVNHAFKYPPRDSIQIIDPDSFPNPRREKRNDRLSTIIEQSVKPWQKHSTGTLKRNVLAAAAFSVDPSARAPIVNFYTSKILAATKHEYYEHGSDIPIPVAVIALETDTPETASKTASLIFNSTINTYQNLQGDLVKISQWQSDRHNADIKFQNVAATKIDLHYASSYIKNGLVDAEYPVKIITATAGSFVVHIDGRYTHNHQELMQFAGRLLTTMQKTAIDASRMVAVR